mmetsp:Transcript_28140/g.78944  ORF Transcript_28140/g.78944 Transcript_28140/m.78944 type:complete len:215 (-) Transcript_28140:230-874(-)
MRRERDDPAAIRDRVRGIGRHDCRGERDCDLRGRSDAGSGVDHGRSRQPRERRRHLRGVVRRSGHLPPKQHHLHSFRHRRPGLPIPDLRPVRHLRAQPEGPVRIDGAGGLHRRGRRRPGLLHRCDVRVHAAQRRNERHGRDPAGRDDRQPGWHRDGVAAGQGAGHGAFAWRVHDGHQRRDSAGRVHPGSVQRVDRGGGRSPERRHVPGHRQLRV